MLRSTTFRNLLQVAWFVSKVMPTILAERGTFIHPATEFDTDKNKSPGYADGFAVRPTVSKISTYLSY